MTTVHRATCRDCDQLTWCTTAELNTADQRCAYCTGSYYRWRLAA